MLACAIVAQMVSVESYGNFADAVASMLARL
jgi:hypothetical protein